MGKSDNRPLYLTLAAIVVILVVAEWRYPPPSPKPADAPADQFSAARAFRILETLIGDETPHPAGSTQNEIVRSRITNLLGEWGYETVEHRTSTTWNGDVLPLVNLLVRIEGTGDGPAMMLACHHDSVPMGPGAADDGAALAATLEIASMLRDAQPLAHDLILLITDGEEFGLLGAERFVAEHPWAEDVAVVLNFEARGTSGPSVMFETNDGNERIVGLYARCAPDPRTSSLFYEVYKHLPNNTDFTIFKAAGMQGCNFAFIGNVRNYHTPNDDLDHLNLGSLQHHGENAWAMLQALGNADLEQITGASDNAIYFDVFGWFVVAWPQRYTIPLAMLAVASTCVAVARLLTISPPTSLRPASWSFIASFLLPAGVAFTILTGLSQSPVLRNGWPAHPLAIQLSVTAASALALVGLAQKIPSATEQSVVAGTWLGFSVLALAAAIWVPGGAYFFIVPLLVGAVVVLAFAKTRFSAWAPMGWPVTLLAVCLPVERLFYDALGFSDASMVAVRLGIQGAACFPLIVCASDGARKMLAGACVVTFVLGLAYAALF